MDINPRLQRKLKRGAEDKFTIMEEMKVGRFLSVKAAERKNRAANCHLKKFSRANNNSVNLCTPHELSRTFLLQMRPEVLHAFRGKSAPC